MDFGFTDDQREIQRTARDLLARTRHAGARARARRGAARIDDGAVAASSPSSAGRGSPSSEEYGGQGLGQIELSILCEELGRALAPVPFLASAMAATVIEHGGSR